MDSNTEQHAQSSHSLCEEISPPTSQDLSDSDHESSTEEVEVPHTAHKHHPTSEDISDEMERALTAANSADEYGDWLKSVQTHEVLLSPYYLSKVCGKVTKSGAKEENAIKKKKKWINGTGVKLLPGRDGLKHLCVLPKGHRGRCCHHCASIFKIGEMRKQLQKKWESAIYSTPGNDGYVFLNRAKRLYSIVLSNIQQKIIRNKKIKKSCGIPLRDASTPLLLLTAYLDYMVFIVNIEDIETVLDTSAPHYETIMNMLTSHKQHLIDRFAPQKIFDDEGYTMCVITQVRSRLEDFCDPIRDLRYDCRSTDIQLGHVECRSDHVVSIRGENLLPMSRRGNLIIGEHNFMKNTWIDELTRIIQIHS